MNARLRFAVVGGGAAGLSAAYVLSRAHDVTIFESEASLGGHAHTILVPDGPDAGTALDAGFAVLNDRNYPTLHRLLAALGVDGIESADMSFGYTCRRANIQYAIDAGAKPAPGDLLNEGLRFWRTASQDSAAGALAGQTLAGYVASRGFSQSLVDHYLTPFGAVAWLMPAEAMLSFPVEMFTRFFELYGMLSLSGGPQWQFIRGGSRRWIGAFERCFPGRIERGVRDLVVRRDHTGVEIAAANFPAERFDVAVLATHADQALRALAEPAAEERRLLGNFVYRPTRAVLHTDPSVMPADRALWASWNATREDDGVSCTFHLNRLHRLGGASRQYFVTLDRATPVADEHVLGEIPFTHPQYTVAAHAAQKSLHSLNGCRHTYFCGSYHGYSGHEDAVRSGVAVAGAFGLTL